MSAKGRILDVAENENYCALGWKRGVKKTHPSLAWLKFTFWKLFQFLLWILIPLGFWVPKMTFGERKSFLMTTSMKLLVTATLRRPFTAIKQKLPFEAVFERVSRQKSFDLKIILSLLTVTPGHDIFNSSQSSFIIYRWSPDAHLLIEWWNLDWQCNYTRNVAIPSLTKKTKFFRVQKLFYIPAAAFH